MDEPGQEQCFCCLERGKPGFAIAGHFLCQDCEHLLLEIQPSNEDYHHLIERCKIIWAGLTH